jgi:hypothetical protein
LFGRLLLLLSDGDVRILVVEHHGTSHQERPIVWIYLLDPAVGLDLSDLDPLRDAINPVT